MFGLFFFFQAEDGIRDIGVTGVQTCALPIFEQAQRRIPVQYAKRMVGRRMYGGTSTYLPLKVNQAGVIPVIFASSLLYLPQLITQLQGDETGPVRQFFENYVIDQSSPVRSEEHTSELQSRQYL